MILLDMNLPDLSGMEVLSRLQEGGLKCQIIIITAYGTIETAEEAIQKGAYDFITKPFRKETILITIRRALEWKRMQGELAALKKQ